MLLIDFARVVIGAYDLGGIAGTLWTRQAVFVPVPLAGAGVAEDDLTAGSCIEVAMLVARRRHLSRLSSLSSLGSLVGRECSRSEAYSEADEAESSGSQGNQLSVLSVGSDTWGEGSRER